LPSRRAVLTALAAATTASVPALAVAGSIASHPDAELLRLGAEFDRRRADYLPACKRCWYMEELFNEEADRRRLRPDSKRTYALWAKLRIETGCDDAATRQNELGEQVDAVTKRIRETPAKTWAGLAIKARALRFDTMLDFECGPENEQDWPELVMDAFVAEIERLTASETA
jgi:hypothetical protein